MTTNHPITPPQELVEQWSDDQASLVTAAKWGADQELAVCIAEVHRTHGRAMADWLSLTRRPKPPSAVAQAETLIERFEDGWAPSPAQWGTIREGLAEGRRALETLSND